jgi:hypothetical protein
MISGVFFFMSQLMGNLHSSGVFYNKHSGKRGLFVLGVRWTLAAQTLHLRVQNSEILSSRTTYK